MFANTNALVGALIAVLSESARLEALIAGGSLSEGEEERLIDRAEQVDAAYGERRLPAHSRLLSLDALKARIATETR